MIQASVILGVLSVLMLMYIIIDTITYRPSDEASQGPYTYEADLDDEEDLDLSDETDYDFDDYCDGNETAANTERSLGNLYG